MEIKTEIKELFALLLSRPIVCFIGIGIFLAFYSFLSWYVAGAIASFSVAIMIALTSLKPLVLKKIKDIIIYRNINKTFHNKNPVLRYIFIVMVLDGKEHSFDHSDVKNSEFSWLTNNEMIFCQGTSGFGGCSTYRANPKYVEFINGHWRNDREYVWVKNTLEKLGDEQHREVMRRMLANSNNVSRILYKPDSDEKNNNFADATDWKTIVRGY